MKLNIIAASVLFFVAASSQATTAAAVEIKSTHKELLQDIKSEVKKCAVKILIASNNHVAVKGFESVCSTLKLISESQAQVLIENNWFTATLLESQDSDNGDLDNMTVQNAAGETVATRSNVPAFDSIVLAMTGGDQGLQTKIAP